MADLLPIDEALELVLGHVQPLAAEDVALDASVGRTLAEAAVTRVDLPPFASSAMDGYALRAADTPGSLSIVGEVAAGHPVTQAVAPGEAMSISTGGAVPEGADVVVPIENVSVTGNSVSIPDNVAEGDNVRPAGSDVPAGGTVLEAGVEIGPAQIGSLAAAGLARVRCACAPRVVVLVTGSELRAPGEELGPGQIYDANGSILEAQLRSAGAAVERLAPVADDEAATRAAIERGLEADVLITTGGVSVGEHDLVRTAEAELGVTEVFWRVALRPGKPVSFGFRDRTLVFGLPGNPVSTLVTFELFVRPALRALQGAAEPRPVFRPGRLAGAVRATAERDSLLRARASVDGDKIVVEALRGQESHMIARAATANALLFVPAGNDELAAGSPVRYLPI